MADRDGRGRDGGFRTGPDARAAVQHAAIAATPAVPVGKLDGAE
jgi:hypothetical protein